MSSVECLRELINERLTAAAEEIFRVFQKTIVEYEEEIDRQRRLLDIVWKPEIKLHRIELLQQHVCKEEEVLTDQQLCNQEKNSSLDQEDPEPPQIKEEQDELCTSLEGEQLVLKQETETFMLTPACEESDNSEDQTLDLSPDEPESEAEKEHVVSMLVKSSVVPEPNSDDQLLSHNSHVAESQDHKGGKHGDSGSTGNAEIKPKKRHRKSKSHSNNVQNTTMSQIQLNSHKGKRVFKCDYCGKAFKYISQLNRHLTIHTDEKPYSCNSCEKRFSVPGALTLHMKVHTGEKPYPCNTCGRRFTQMAKVKRHMRTHTELPQQHVCKEEEVLADQQLCNQERNSSLDQEDPEPPQIKEEQEELCTSLEGEQLVLKQEESDYSEDQTLDWSPDETQSAAEKEHVVSMSVKSSVVPNSDDRLLSHISHVAESQGHKRGKGVDSGSTRNLETKPQKRHHKSKSHSDNVCNTTMSKIQLDTQTGKKVLKCDTCGKAFKYVSQLNRHHRVHTGEKPYSCNSCERRFSLAGALKVHMRVHTGEKPYPCNTCGKRFSQITKVKKHMKTHTREKPYPCNICEKRFSHLGILKVHMRVHTGEKPYPCNTCEKRFSHLCALHNHMRIHTGEKPYPCNTCEKSFSQLGALKVHKRIHTGEKPYPCNTCEKRFADLSAWKRHMRIHTGEKPYPCNTCEKKFSHMCALQKHMRIHTGERPYPCNTCEKRFSELGALKVHMRVHTGEKPYPCNICDKRFSQLVVLQTHMRIHTGEKPYSCNTCEKRFSQVGALQTHMRVHTGEKPYNCKTCGTDFMRRHQLKTHMRTHTVGKDSVRCQT
ncbi:zinc finger protein 271-like isoform X5 [Thunnus albacares]|uniref:zinc finger protein 271-like isoform X5 n=1 Tax=Thunnus albacares TaxID=8236 RepID=UPI001CF6B508|nr:zinc finger protein 271-like isoform X5 [Thunnus albacares]